MNPSQLERFRKERDDAIAQLSDEQKQRALVNLVDGATLCYDRAHVLYQCLDRDGTISSKKMEKQPVDVTMRLFGCMPEQVIPSLGTPAPSRRRSGQFTERQSNPRELLNKDFGRASCFLGIARHIAALLPREECAPFMARLTKVRERAETHREDMHHSAPENRGNPNRGVYSCYTGEEFGMYATQMAVESGKLLKQVTGRLHRQPDGDALQFSSRFVPIPEVIALAGAERMAAEIDAPPSEALPEPQGSAAAEPKTRLPHGDRAYRQRLLGGTAICAVAG